MARISEVPRARSSGSPDPEEARAGDLALQNGDNRRARACPSPGCLNQDGQDKQDGQDNGYRTGSPRRCQVPQDMPQSILNLTVALMRRNHPHPENPAHPGNPASDK